MKTTNLELVRVHYMPINLEEGKLYYSEEYGTAIHLCPCGCGHLTVTPVKGTWKDTSHCWDITIEDEKPTLNPSISNYQIPCKSHYFVRNGEIVWA